VGSKVATAQGTRIFERLNKAILASVRSEIFGRSALYDVNILLVGKYCAQRSCRSNVNDPSGSRWTNLWTTFRGIIGLFHHDSQELTNISQRQDPKHLAVVEAFHGTVVAVSVFFSRLTQA